MNKPWHAAHVLGKGASPSVRIAWHRAHQQHCACRPIPQSLVALMMKPPDDARARAFSNLEARFSGDPRVTRGGRGFGATSLKLDGKIFAMLSPRQGFVVKLPRERVADLVSAGRGRPFEGRKGKSMKEWVVVDQPPARWFALAQEARVFVSSI